jgi:putative ABC transport system substrate-binding protein
VVFGGSVSCAETVALPKKVAITQIVEHPALNRTRQGVEDGLKKSGIPVEIIYENAQGNLVTATQIIQHFVSQGPDLIVAIATPSAQTAVTGGGDIPVVFAAVSNPQAAGLLESANRHRVVGTIDLPPVADQLTYFKAVLPHLKRVGVIYNPGEANSRDFVEALKGLKDRFGLEVVESAITRTSDVSLGIQKLLGEKVDAILLPQDNTVVSALDVVVNLSQAAWTPLLTSDSELVGRGAFAAIGYNHYDTGLATAELVKKILTGTPPKDLPVVPGGKLERLVNGKLINLWKITVPRNAKGTVVE